MELSEVLYCEVESEPMIAVIPGVCVDNLSSSVNIDFPWNTRNLPLCVFGQQFKAQTTPGTGHEWQKWKMKVAGRSS